MKKSYLIIIHILFWLLFLFHEYITFKSNIYELTLSWFVVNFTTFYFNYLLVIPFLVKKRKLNFYILGLLSSLLFFTILRYFIEETLFPIFLGYSNYFEGTTFSFYLFDNLYFGSHAVFISSLIWFLNYSIKIEKENKALLKEKNVAEISLLKSQINPHFIFNTLNNIYSLVNQKSEKSLPAIERLGDLLRFSGTEMTKDFTLLSNEIKYIQSLIDLESMRLSKPSNIQFHSNVLNLYQVKIAPMLLIPFVENAFKHGDLINSELIISIESNHEEIRFHQKNKITNLNKEKSSGIGIENVKRRLNLIYPNKNTLKITSENGFYEVALAIKI